MRKVENSENNYQNGKIYKLVSFQTDKVYVGSTYERNLNNRLAKHRVGFRDYKLGKRTNMTSFELLKYEDVDIILIENYPCNNKQELHARERYWIEALDCVNKNIPTRTNKMYYQDHKEQIKERVGAYREANKEVIKQKKKDYREKNKTAITAKKSEYYQNNKGEIAERKKEKITCGCGREFRKCDAARHNQSKQHQEHIKQLANVEAV